MIPLIFCILATLILMPVFSLIRWHGQHIHDPRPTGRMIYAVYGKPNLPANATPVESVGPEYVCPCGAHFIKHTARYAEPITELEAS